MQFIWNCYIVKIRPPRKLIQAWQIADSIAYFYRQALKTVNKSENYTIPSTTVYGTEYSTGTLISLNELTNFNAGSFTQTDSGYATLPYTLKHNANAGNIPITFSTQGKGIFIVYSAKDDVAFCNLNNVSSMKKE